MRVAGIVAEYNPFHSGHLLQVQHTRKYAGCDYVVAVMAGAFTQRGDPALFDKWQRVRAALRCGVDAVFELPALFAVRPAGQFAAAGVDLLNALGVVDTLSFGCETDDIVRLSRLASLLDEEPEELRARIRQKLDAGCSHARARGEALAELMRMDPAEVNAPNTVLALEYIRANNRLETHMELHVVRRRGDYHDPRLGEAASATAVRAALREGRIDEALSSVPQAVRDLYARALQGGASDPRALDGVLLYRLRNISAQTVAELVDVNEGLENRISRAAREAASREDLLARVKCKRYTMARLNRILTGSLLGLTKELAQAVPTPPYARLLGFRECARPLLRTIASTAAIPLISDPVALKDDECFQLEMRATDLWGLTVSRENLRRADRDLTEKMAVELD